MFLYCLAFLNLLFTFSDWQLFFHILPCSLILFVPDLLLIFNIPFSILPFPHPLHMVLKHNQFSLTNILFPLFFEMAMKN